MNPELFRAGILGLFIVALCDLLVAWALYFFLKPISLSISLLAAWLRLVYTVFLGMALLNYLDVLQLISGAEYLRSFETNQLNAEIMLSLEAFRSDWNFGLIFFGGHLALIGYLALKSNYIPKIIGIILILAGVSYLIDYLGVLISPNAEVAVSLYLGWGELVFMFWLLIRGWKLQQTG